jgi:cAMP-dependent protein kinase regulator
MAKRRGEVANGTRRAAHAFAASRCVCFSFSQIFDSMEEMKVRAGDVIIEQGKEGDYFYVIDAGQFNVYLRSPADAPSDENDGYGKQVFQYETGGSFGELALMYNVARAATVRAVTDGILWRVDRETFRHLIIDSTAHKRRKYEEFLESVPLLSGLTRQERAQVADCLETVTFPEGAMIIKQGEEGDKLYLIIEGKAKATQTASGTKDAVEVGRMAGGAYFGEKSLLTREPRAANVIAVTPMVCACLDRSAFERLLGPLKNIMKQHAAQYVKAQDVLKTQSPGSAGGGGSSSAAGSGAPASGASAAASGAGAGAQP